MRPLAFVAGMFLGCMSQAEKDDVTNICFAAERTGSKDIKNPYPRGAR